jgi:hypothetical protein
MDSTRYVLCLALLSPVMGFSAFVIFMESWNRYGFITVTDRILATVLDPLGDGRWGVALVGTLTFLLGSGFFATTRTVAFAALATLGIAFTVFLGAAMTNTRNFEWPVFLLLVPTLPAIALSAGAARRSYRSETISAPSAHEGI